MSSEARDPRERAGESQEALTNTKKLKTNIRYFMQLRQSPSMVLHLENTRPFNPSGDTQVELSPSPSPSPQET